MPFDTELFIAGPLREAKQMLAIATEGRSSP